MVAKKLDSGKRTMGTGCADRLTTSVWPTAKVAPTCPSTVTKSSSGPSSTRTVISEVGGSTSGRNASVCALTGVTRMVSSVGNTTGPPADRLYAVDPVGVAITTPSAE